MLILHISLKYRFYYAINSQIDNNQYNMNEFYLLGYLFQLIAQHL